MLVSKITDHFSNGKLGLGVLEIHIIYKVIGRNFTTNFRRELITVIAGTMGALFYAPGHKFQMVFQYMQSLARKAANFPELTYGFKRVLCPSLQYIMNGCRTYSHELHQRCRVCGVYINNAWQWNNIPPVLILVFGQFYLMLIVQLARCRDQSGLHSLINSQDCPKVQDRTDGDDDYNYATQCNHPHAFSA